LCIPTADLDNGNIFEIPSKYDAEKYRKAVVLHLFFRLLQVDYASIFIFRSLMFIDNGLAAGLSL
jgi:hypothetical protein